MIATSWSIDEFPSPRYCAPHVKLWLVVSGSTIGGSVECLHDVSGSSEDITAAERIIRHFMVDLHVSNLVASANIERTGFRSEVADREGFAVERPGWTRHSSYMQTNSAIRLCQPVNGEGSRRYRDIGEQVTGVTFTIRWEARERNARY